MALSSFGALATALGAVAVLDHEELRAMERACVILEESAKGAIGTYEFGWPPLSESAIAKHGDTPLLDTGALKESITHEVESGKLGYVGTNSDYAKYQEFGTSKIPPRPFLGGAIAHKGQEAADCFAEEVHLKLVGGR